MIVSGLPTASRRKSAGSLRGVNRLPAISIAAALAAATAAAPASAAQPRFERIGGVKAPGTPAKYNRVGILKIGKPKAKNILVLNPGTSASAAYFAPLAKSIVARSPKWQVWAVERRENLLEDHSVLNQGKTGKATIKQVFNYYLGWLKDSSISPHVRLIPDSEVGYARQWGMATEIGDLRRVVLKARKQGGKVVVGGHSLGGTITTAYATWDFNGKAGAKGLSGLVFIDGGSSPDAVSRSDAKQELADLKTGTPWLAFGGIPAPYAGLFALVGSGLAVTDPDSPSLFQNYALLPPALKPPVDTTNLAGFGYDSDADTSPSNLIAFQVHDGQLAASGDPRGWDQAGDITPVARYAAMLFGSSVKGSDGSAWYHPLRLTLDAGAIGDGNKNPAQKVMGVRATHGDDIHVPIFAFAAALGGQRVVDATQALADQSGLPSRDVTIIDRHHTYSHNDPNAAFPKNAFVSHVVPYLRGVAQGR
jgi:pimeloyl-ACP methyl ester carboxylesterase